MDEENPLWWFDQLTLDDRVALLADPYRSLPVRLIKRFADRPGTGARAYFPSTSTGFDGGFPLAPAPSRLLSDYRDQLDYWWDNQPPEQREFLIDNRNGLFPPEYGMVVMSATELPLPEDNPLAVVIVRDDAGSFRLPGLVAVYVELKARLRAGEEIKL